MATPHVASVAALMLQKDPTLTQSDVESILESSALDLGAGSRTIWDITKPGGAGWVTISWGVDAVGEGVLQADAAVAAVP